MKLSPRLSILLESGVSGGDFWDICCDHGLLGRAALASKRFSNVHFNDQIQHVIERLRESVDDPRAHFHLSAAQDLSVPLTGTVVIAGVGGFNMIKILTAWEERGNLRAQRLLLNPLTHVTELRDFLAVWPAYEEIETINVRERNRERQILVLNGRLPIRLRT